MYTTTLIVEQIDQEMSDLGIDNNKIKYYSIQIDVRDIQFHHAFDHETDDGGITEGSIIQFYDGDRIATLAPFKELEELRKTEV